MKDLSDPKYSILEGYFIHDCCILASDYFAVCAEEYLPEKEFDYYTSRGHARIAFYDVGSQKIDHPPSWGASTWPRHNFFNTRLVNMNESELLMIDDSGTVYYGGLGDNKHREQKIPTKRLIHNLAKVGDQIYGIGAGREILKRVGPDTWEPMTLDIIDRKARSQGFSDLAGFSIDDLYAVGGKSDIWHYNGQRWRPLDVSNDFRPLAVCCAEDGYVYIAGAWGMIARGRGDEWEVYCPNPTISAFTAVVSYQGRIFFGSESRVYVLDHNADSLEYQLYDFEGQITPFAARRMDVGHGLMMFASLSSVAIYDGSEWKKIYGGGPSKQEEAQLLESMLRDSEATLDAMDYSTSESDAKYTSEPVDKDLSEIDAALNNIKLYEAQLLANVPPREKALYERLYAEPIIAPIDNGPGWVERLWQWADEHKIKSSTFTRLLKDVPKIQQLDLSGKDIHSLPPEFGKLTRLKFLNLKDNQLTLLPKEFANLQSLEKISLENNQLVQFPTALCELTQLDELRLQNNKLTSIPKEIGYLAKLKALNLQHNCIKTLPDVFDILPRLSKLELQYNQLTSLPNSLVIARKLFSIDVSFNQLEELPPLYKSHRLDCLDASHNKIRVLDTGYLQLGSGLAEINLDHNLITRLPDEVGLLYLKLRECGGLTIDDNPIDHDSLSHDVKALYYHFDLSLKEKKKVAEVLPERPLPVWAESLKGWAAEHDIEAFDGMSEQDLINMYELDMSYKELKSIPKEIGELKNLRILYLRENKLRSLPAELENCTELRVLDISNNKIMSLPRNFKQLELLDTVNLRHNSIKKIPVFIKHMKKLRYLNLNGCNIESLPDWVLAVPGIEIVDLRSNYYLAPQNYPTVVLLD